MYRDPVAHILVVRVVLPAQVDLGLGVVVLLLLVDDKGLPHLPRTLWHLGWSPHHSTVSLLSLAVVFTGVTFQASPHIGEACK